MILLDCPVKQFTLQVSLGVDATCPLGRSEQLPHMADFGAEGTVVKFSANASGKVPSKSTELAQPRLWLESTLRGWLWISVQVLLVNGWQCLDLSDWSLPFPTTNDLQGAIPVRIHSRCVAFLMEDG